MRIRALVVLIAVPLSLHAQTSEVQPGARVRVQAPGVVAGRYVGTVLTTTADTIRVGAPNMQPVAIPTSRIATLEVSRGNSRALGAGRGALWGAGIAVGVGLVVIATSNYDYNNSYYGGNRASDLAVATLSGAFYGLVIGAIVGRERWETFDLPARTSLRLVPSVTPQGVGAAVRLGF